MTWIACICESFSPAIKTVFYVRNERHFARCEGDPCLRFGSGLVAKGLKFESALEDIVRWKLQSWDSGKVRELLPFFFSFWVQSICRAFCFGGCEKKFDCGWCRRENIKGNTFLWAAVLIRGLHLFGIGEIRLFLLDSRLGTRFIRELLLKLRNEKRVQVEKDAQKWVLFLSRKLNTEWKSDGRFG